MSKICVNCGTELEDSANVCTVCGTAVEPPAAPRSAAPRKKKSAVDNMLKKLKKNPKILLIPAAAVVVLLAIIIGLLWNPVFNPWRSALDNYGKLTVEGKSSAVSKAAPKAVWEYIEDQTGISQDDFKKDKKRFAEDAAEDAQDRFGTNAKFSYKVTKSKKMTKDMVAAYGEALENRYDIDKDSVKAGVVVEYKYEVSGKRSFEWGEGKAYIVKISSGLFSSGWYLVNQVDVADEEPSTSIMTVQALQSTDLYSKKAEY